MIDRYLLDNVTLSKMTTEQLTTRFVQTLCAVPTPVLYEAEGLPGRALLDGVEYGTTPEVLEQVKFVLACVTDDDKLLDLYHNEGNGDVFLLAVALTERAVAAGQLLPDRWTIATDDGGLTRKAAELGIATCTSSEFIELISENTGGSS